MPPILSSEVSPLDPSSFEITENFKIYGMACKQELLLKMSSPVLFPGPPSKCKKTEEQSGKG